MHPSFHKRIPDHFDLWLIASFLAITFWVEWIVNLTLQYVKWVEHPVADAFLDSMLVLLISLPIIFLVLLRPVRQGLRQYQQALKRLHVVHAEMRHMLDASPNPIFLLDRQAHIQYANPTAATLLGLPKEKLIGQELQPFLQSGSASLFLETLAGLPSEPGEVKTIELPEMTLRPAREGLHPNPYRMVLLTTAAFASRNDLVMLQGTASAPADSIRQDQSAAMDQDAHMAAAEGPTAGPPLEARVATQIQDLFLVGRHPGGLRSLGASSFYQPSPFIDGLFFDLLPYGDAAIDVLIGRVSGYGLRANLLAATIKTQAQAIIAKLLTASEDRHLPLPREIVTSLHAAMVGQLIEEDRLTNLCFARFVPKSRILNFVDCGHGSILHWVHETGIPNFLKGENSPLGYQRREHYREITRPYQDNDIFVVYSSALVEATNSAGEAFSEQRLAEIVEQTHGLEAAGIQSAIYEAVRLHIGTMRPTADLACIVLKAMPQPQVPSSDLLQLKLNSRLEQLAEVREQVDNFLQGLSYLPVSSHEITLVTLALNEALTNVITHAYHLEPERQIDLDVAASAEGIDVTIKHEGDSFVGVVRQEVDADFSLESGYGLFIMEKAMDQVQYFRDCNGRNGITLKRRFPDSTRIREMDGRPSTP
ncbi:MAG: SpoIIE family protein phosphatase [Verrucomicrobiota bacterium]|nr:SpoIIE family protein phosphatase [Verrucomicrobiota bacterium]